MVRFYAIKLFVTFFVIFCLILLSQNADSKKKTAKPKPPLWFEYWYEIRLSGQRVGNSHVKAYIIENKNTPYLQLEYNSKFQMKRNGQTIEYSSLGQSLSSAMSFEPISFEHQEQQLKKTITGKFDKQFFQINQTLGDQKTITQMIEPQKNMIIDEHLGFYLVKNITHKKFQNIANINVINTSEGFIEQASFQLIQSNQPKNELIVKGKIGQHELISAYDFEGKLLWSENPALEMKIERVTSDIANEPFQMVDSYDSSRILIDSKLTKNLRSLTLKMKVSANWKPAIDDMSQWKKQTNDTWIITTKTKDTLSPKTQWNEIISYKTDLQLKPFLEPTLQEPIHQRLIEKAHAITKDIKNVYLAAEKLNDWVYSHVSNKNFSKIYASALETLDSKEGDCTEHSVLLSALAKNLGIPSKIIDGLVYHDGAFIFHEWVELYIDGWKSFDPTLKQNPVDITHIKIAESTTDPQSRQPSIYVIGRLRTKVNIEVIDFKN